MTLRFLSLLHEPFPFIPLHGGLTTAPLDAKWPPPVARIQLQHGELALVDAIRLDKVMQRGW